MSNCAAKGLSLAMNSVSSSKFCIAFASHLIFTHAPLCKCLCDEPITSELAPVCFGNGLLDLPNLPIVEFYKLLDCFGS